MSGTEAISPRYRGLDTWTDEAVLEALWEGQARAIAAVRPALPAIAAAARAIASRLGTSGRLVYAGAGSAGRQAALDGMELGATFGWPATRIALVLPEGTALDPAVRGSDEDETGWARDAVARLALGRADAMIAVAASGTTPFTLVAAEAARAAGALVVAIANNAGTPLLAAADHPILLDTGPEAIAGSTRMNAGTAHKAALGLLSSLLMTRLGHVHDGLMVSMRADCAKLTARAARIVAAIAGCPEDAAATALGATGGSIKPAVLVALGTASGEAERLLAEAGGNLRVALGRRSCSE
jgi:N-acetylmuramic acid 6-phosphate etherase